MEVQITMVSGEKENENSPNRGRLGVRSDIRQKHLSIGKKRVKETSWSGWPEGGVRARSKVKKRLNVGGCLYIYTENLPLGNL